MADTGKKPAPESGAVDNSAAAPNEVKESPNASFLVKTAWPHTSFDMPDDGVPRITSDGTKLTKTQLATVEESAKASGVELIVEEVK